MHKSKKTYGCESIPIAKKGSYINWKVSCITCKEYKSKHQLEIKFY